MSMLVDATRLFIFALVLSLAKASVALSGADGLVLLQSHALQLPLELPGSRGSVLKNSSHIRTEQWIARRHEPRTQQQPILPMLAQKIFDLVIVHCYKKSCAKYLPGGGAWPEELRHKIVVQDGFETDQMYSKVLDRIGKAHGLKAFLSHMVAIEFAHNLNLTSVLVIEDDLVESETVSSLTKSEKIQLVDRLDAALASTPWEGLKFTANYMRSYEPLTNTGTCKAPCHCKDQLALMSHPQRVTMCRTSKKQNGSKPCSNGNSAGYAVHKSAFPTWLKALDAARSGKVNDSSLMAVGCHIDHWLPAAMDLWNVLPLLGVQEFKPQHEDTSITFQKLCVV